LSSEILAFIPLSMRVDGGALSLSRLGFARLPSSHSMVEPKASLICAWTIREGKGSVNSDLLRAVDVLDLEPNHFAGTQSAAVGKTEQHACP
jgi:hypothetical protein